MSGKKDRHPTGETRCSICKRLLNQEYDPTTLDCGGDCELCMAEAGDPECIAGVLKAVRERGIRGYTEENCPGHVAAPHDKKVCGRCGVHIDELRPD